MQKELHPLHLLIFKLSNTDIIDSLPAGHSLTGCNTVAKVGTKLELLKILSRDGNAAIIKTSVKTVWLLTPYLLQKHFLLR